LISPRQILIIQPSFLGDVILTTSLVETLATSFPEASIDFMVRKGNESLLANNPNIRSIIVWDKKHQKLANLWKIARAARKTKYDAVINTHRFASSGFVALMSGAKYVAGFNKNPLSFAFTHRVNHVMSGVHETERNFALIASLVSTDAPSAPRLYPSEQDEKLVSEYTQNPFVCIAPTSVWFTKQWPGDKWKDLITEFPDRLHVYLLGAPSDKEACQHIIEKSQGKRVINLAGELSLLQSAALMSKAEMNYVNDSGPMHLASAMDAPCTAVFCSTVPDFGFGPLSTKSRVVETTAKLDCRPCGIHGHKACPEGHFKCAVTIDPKHVSAHERS